MLIVVGCNHRSAPVSLRERLAFGEAELTASLQRLVAPPEIAEALVLSTCNRVEVLVRTEATARGGLERVKDFLCHDREVSRDDLERHAYHREGRAAISHLFEVASGLDSMILGEPQILGQVRQAYRVAREAGVTGKVLDRLLQQCLATAARVRTSTGISKHAVSIAFAAVELARQIFGKLPGRHVLLLGTGKMAELVARHLMTNGVRSVTVTGRTFNNAVAAAERVKGSAVHWDDGLEMLSKVDIVVSCTAAPGTVLGRGEVAHAMRARRGRPLFVIDIAVPRDVDPSVNRLDNVYLYDIDGLQGVVAANLETRRRAAEEARALIAADVEAFERWRQGLAVVPTIVALRGVLEATGTGEMERFRRRLGPLAEDQEQALREMVRALIRKVLHHPTVYLRKSVERGDAQSTIEMYRKLFRLGEEAAGPTRASRGDRPAESAPRGPRRILRGGKNGPRT